MTKAKIVLALLGGAAIGATIGILLAPESGVDTRERLKERASGMADRIITFADQILQEVERRTRQTDERA